MSGIYFSILAFSIVFTTALLWFRLLRAVSLPRNRGGFVASMLIGVGLAVTGLVQGSGLAVATLSGLSILLGGMFIALVLISKQIGGSGTLQPGSPLMAFSAPDHLGNNFASSSLDGRPILLKFFRGHW